MGNRKSTVKAFRLGTELLNGIRIAAERARVSENAFVQGVLSQRVKADPFVNAIPYIILSKQCITSILGVTNADLLQMVGFDLGKKNFSLARDLYESIGADLSFVQYIREVLDGQAHWFVTEGASIRPERMTLHHEYGPKWSSFLGSFLTGAYEVVSRGKIKVGTSDAFVSLEITKTAV
jgi:hypothetical protein